VESCREEIGGPSTIAFVFISNDWANSLDELIEIVQVYGHTAHVVGCTSESLICTGEEHEDTSGCSLLFLSLPDTKVEVLTMEEYEAEAETLSLGVKPREDASWITLCNPRLMHAEAWMLAWNEAVNQAPTFGGLAGGNDPTEFRVFHNHSHRDLAVVAVQLQGGIRVEGVVSQGCRPIGEPYTITQVDDNQLIQIASRKAFEVLEATVKGLSEREKIAAQGNLFVGLAMSEYVDEFKRGDFLVRNILGGDPEAGILAVGAYPRTGQTVQFQIRDKEAASDDLREMCQSKMTESGSPFAGLLFSCSGRGQSLFKVPNHDAALIADTFGRVPLTGFFCNGEIGPIGSSNFLHGYTASTAFLYHA